MKRCPTCGLTLDDSQTYCTNDGTPLITEKSYDPQATMIISPDSVPTAPPSPAKTPPPQQTGWQPPARPTVPPPAYGSPQQMNYGQQAGAARPGKFVPGLIGGAIAGILSLFAGFMSPEVFIIFSFFCVVWAFIGGAVASNLYIKRSSLPVRTGEGAVMGVIAGAIGALIYIVLDTPVAYYIHADYIQMAVNQQPEKISPGAFFALSGLSGAVMIFGFSIIGGLVGVPMFEKRKGYHPGMPPPPPGYGVPPPGGYR
jgi:hypothetical protein